MSKQSNQRYRKELEKSRNTYSDGMNHAKQNECQNSSNTATDTSSKNQETDLIDRYQN